MSDIKLRILRKTTRFAGENGRDARVTERLQYRVSEANSFGGIDEYWLNVPIVDEEL